MSYKINIFFVLMLVNVPLQANSICNHEPWWSYNGVELMRNNDASAYYFVTAHKSVDADGAPNAYHPDDTGLDYLANAGYPNKKWWKSVLVADPENSRVAYRQKAGEYKGYFVSKTSLQDKNKNTYDPTRYVDATAFPYLVFPGAFYSKTGTGMLGDIGFSINLSTGATSAFVVADIGPTEAQLGEISISLAEQLGGNSVNPRNGVGVPKGDILYILFPYSTRTHNWPLTKQQIDSIAVEKMASLGGVDSFLSCTKRNVNSVTE